jgi:hypothetical protein
MKIFLIYKLKYIIYYFLFQIKKILLEEIKQNIIIIEITKNPEQKIQKKNEPFLYKL